MRQKTRFEPAAKLTSFYSGGPLATSRDGDLIACAHGDGVKVVNSCDGEVQRDLDSGGQLVTALTFGCNSSVLYASTRGLQIICWNTTTGRTAKAWKVNCVAVVCIALNKQGNLLALGASDRTVRVWDVDGKFCTHAFRGHSAPVQQVLFPPHGLLLITSAEDGDIRVWDMATNACKAQLKGHFAAVTALSLATDGQTLLSAGRDKIAILWDLCTSTKLRTFPVFEAVEGAQILNVPKQAGCPSEMDRGEVRSIIFATAGDSGTVRLWECSSGKSVATYTVEGSSTSDNQISHLAVDGNGVLIAVTIDARLIFLNPKESQSILGTSILKFEALRELIGDHGEITDLSLMGPCNAPNYLAIATNSPIIRVYDVGTGTHLASLIGHKDIVLCLGAASPDSDHVILISGCKDGYIALWAVQATSSDESGAGHRARNTVQCLANARAHMAAVTGVAVGHAEASNLAVSVSADKMLKVWRWRKSSDEGRDIENQLQSSNGVGAHQKDINCVAISPDESLVCTGSQDRTAKVWRLPNLLPVATLQGHKRGVWSVSFSPIERVIATASGDHTVKLWAIENGSCLKTLQGHSAPVLRLLHITLGSQLISASADGLLKLWSIRSSECIATFDEHADRIWALAGTSSGSLLATGGSDATVCIWHDTTEKQLKDSADAKTAETEARQGFSNALKEGNISEALQLSWTSANSQQFWSVIEQLQHEHTSTAPRLLTDLILGFSDEQLKKALCMSRDWNTRVQHAEQAQAVLSTIFSCHRPKVLTELPALDDALEGLAPYTERHMAHTDRLLMSSGVLDYTLLRMHYVPDTPTQRPAA